MKSMIAYKKATTLGKIIKELRIENKEKQSELAEKIGIKRVSLSSLETGRALPGMETFIRICEHYKTSPNYFLGYSETKYDL